MHAANTILDQLRPPPDPGQGLAAAVCGRPGSELLILAVLAIAVGGWVTISHGRCRFPSHPLPFCLLWYLNRGWTVFRYRVRRIGRCTVPRTGAVILTANHGSTADPLMLYSTCPHRAMGFMIAREFASLPVYVFLLATSPVWSVAFRCGGMVGIPPRLRLRFDVCWRATCWEYSSRGESLHQGGPKPPKDGVAMLALRTGATVVPAYISGQVYRDGIAASFFARHRARVRYGPPVDLGGLSGGNRESIEKATAKIHAAIMELRSQAQARGERVEASPKSM